MGRDAGPADDEHQPDEAEAPTIFPRSPPSPSDADGPPDEPYADSPGASIDSEAPVEPNEPA